MERAAGVAWEMLIRGEGASRDAGTVAMIRMNAGTIYLILLALTILMVIGGRSLAGGHG
jgi:hypothetical protein